MQLFFGYNLVGDKNIFNSRRSHDFCFRNFGGGNPARSYTHLQLSQLRYLVRLNVGTKSNPVVIGFFLHAFKVAVNNIEVD